MPLVPFMKSLMGSLPDWLNDCSNPKSKSGVDCSNRIPRSSFTVPVKPDGVTDTQASLAVLATAFAAFVTAEAVCWPSSSRP